MSRGARLRGIVGLAITRILRRGTRSRQIALNVAGVALPVALMLIVTSVSLGLATGTTVQSSDIDYWIVPESSAEGSAVVSAGGPQFGRVHAASDRIARIEGVTYATPVLLELVRLEHAGTEEFVLAVGIVPGSRPTTISGVSTAGLQPDDPHYGDGRYDGPWTGEVVLSGAAAELLNASTGSELEIKGGAVSATNRSFTVANVSRGEASSVGRLPIALVHLSELQALTGVAGEDRADQLLVETNRRGVKEELAGVYPRSMVLSRSGLTAQGVADSELPLAISVTALVVAIVVGVLFAASTMGLAIAGDARNRALLAALGFSGRSRALLVVVQTLVVAFAGGVAGTALGLAGIPITNALVRRFIADLAVARFHPALAGYGIGVALLIGVLTVPYLLVMSRRTTTVASLQE